MDCCIKSYLHIVGTVIFLVIMSSWIITNYPYLLTSETLEVLRNIKSACIKSMVMTPSTSTTYDFPNLQCDYRVMFKWIGAFDIRKNEFLVIPSNVGAPMW